MLLIKTYLAPSRIHGIGLFANEDIKKGTITWRFDPAIDILITEEQISRLPINVSEFIKEYGSLSKSSHKYVLSADNTRFTNHSSKPNLESKFSDEESEAIAIANRDINKGEELTIDYRVFDKLSENSKQDYLL
ncbi:MAG: SET domain-containing protein [Candidatus Woesebacteria bacterium]|nr:SET domain-containing protein [Candidatus Woesebacteria bacterium]